MPPRLCVAETCTISPAVDPITGELILDVPLNPVGGLDCNDDTGVFVQRLGNVAPVNESGVDPDCVHRVLVTDQGNLYVEPKPMIPIAQGAGATVDFAAVGDHVSLQYDVTNIWGCDVHVRAICQQPQVLLVADPVPEPESPPGSGLKHLRWQGTTFIDSSIADVNGQNRSRDRHDVNTRVPDGDDGNTHQFYHQIEVLVPLTPGQTSTFQVGINTGLIQGWHAAQANGAGFTAFRNWVEVYRTGTT